MMAVQLFDTDIIRMTFIIGIMTSALLYERTHLTTGSLVVPGYVAAQLLNPAALVVTAANSILTYLLVARVLPRFVAVYGRALFVANILVSILLSLIFEPALTLGFGQWGFVFDSIGYVIPALIAYDMKRQGPSKTLVAVGAASALAAIPALVIAGLFPGWIEPILPTDAGLLAVGEEWFAVAALASAVVSTGIQANYGLRSGGFIGSMYLGLIAVRPSQLLFVAALALVTYGLVVHGLGRVMILFGRRKFAVMLVGGSLLSWASLTVLEVLQPGLLTIGELPIAALFVPALLANDMERTSVPAVAVGGLLAGSLTLSLVSGMAAVVDGVPVQPWVLPLLVISGTTLLWPQLRVRLRDRRPRPRFGDPPSSAGSGRPPSWLPGEPVPALAVVGVDGRAHPARSRSARGLLDESVDVMEPTPWPASALRWRVGQRGLWTPNP